LFQGSGIIKKRVALPGRGKRGSARTLVATNSANRWFFVFGFKKNDRDNINAKELSALKALASDLLRLGVSELSAAAAAKTLQEICHENKNTSEKSNLRGCSWDGRRSPFGPDSLANVECASTTRALSRPHTELLA